MLQEVTQENIAKYLASVQFRESSQNMIAKTLAWGVSNIVIRIRPEVGDDFVLKQSRKQLRTKVEWLSNLDRIWREMEVMRELHTLLPEKVVPQILFEDRDNYLFIMEAIDEEHLVWKAELLEGRFEQSVAQNLGEYLACIHRQTFMNTSFQSQFQDWEVFDQLRIDPFYRFIVNSHPDLENWINKLIEEMSAHRISLVLADFSPKNILISKQGIHLIDFETAHFGDPAFDLGFFLSHLLLKVIHFQQQGSECLQLADLFWKAYTQHLASESIDHQTHTFQMDLEGLNHRTLHHLAACMLARIDGKSPVDYITEEAIKEQVRSFALSLIHNPPVSVPKSFSRLSRFLNLPLLLEE
ncbi:MAG: phosphotransferase [Planctomycetaceae bacterium]|nr:phosphotransferase [Planctomycetaceae bacterium]